MIDVLSGAPQGSKLGPVLFMMFMNSMTRVINFGKIKLFADDAKIYLGLRDSNQATMLATDLASVLSWIEVIQLRLSASKCAVLNLGHTNPTCQYYINGIAVPVVNEFSDLGITVCVFSCLGLHVDKISLSGHRTSNLILRCFTFRKPNFLIKFFKAYVRPKLEYDTEV